MAHLARASDAERMDRHYRFQRHVYDVTREHYLLGRRHLVEDLAPAPGASVLEIGCGTARNLVRVAQRYPQARLNGVDISAAMLETAARSLARHDLAGRVALRQGDATDFDAEALFGLARYDRVFFSYALSMIPRWREALAHAAGMLAPGGTLHVVDFGQCERLPAPFKSGLFAFLAYYGVTARGDLEACCREIAAHHDLRLRFERLYGGYSHYAVLRRQG